MYTETYYLKICNITPKFYKKYINFMLIFSKRLNLKNKHFDYIGFHQKYLKM